ncbi:hypothetical protein JQK62_21585, partial [Leptospira santarosai]|nr:hypothetical protein [Leptospira santarosai]
QKAYLNDHIHVRTELVLLFISLNKREYVVGYSFRLFWTKRKLVPLLPAEYSWFFFSEGVFRNSRPLS